MKNLSYNSKIVEQLVRPEFLSMDPYPASKTIAELAQQLKIPQDEIIKLNSAENTMVESLYPKKLNGAYYRYPDPYSLELRKKIGEYVGFTADWVVCGNGSDELIDLLIPLFVGKNDNVLISPPTFPMYEFFCKIRGVKIKKVPKSDGLTINAKKLASAINKKTKLVFIDSPGNPTGSLINEKEITELLIKKVIVVVDEAYFEYSGKTLAPLIKKFSNLIILRSFSKWAGLAGLRLGYLIANPKIIKAFLLMKPPYNVNSVAQELGLVALNKRRQFLKKIKQSIKVKKQIVAELKKFENFEIVEGKGSYILIRVKTGGSKEIVDELTKRGILVKPLKQSVLADSFLISLESRPKMKIFIKSLKIINQKIYATR